LFYAAVEMPTYFKHSNLQTKPKPHLRSLKKFTFWAKMNEIINSDKSGWTGNTGISINFTVLQSPRVDHWRNEKHFQLIKKQIKLKYPLTVNFSYSAAV